MEQRAEPPSWVPDSGRPRTGAAADLRSPEADEAAAGTPDGDTDYNFSAGTSYSDSQDTTFLPAEGAGGYTYDPGLPGDTTAAVPPYPAASLTEPVGGPATTGTSPAPGGAADSPSPAPADEGRNRTSRFSAIPRGGYKDRSGPAAAGTALGGAAAGASPAAARKGSQAPARRADLVLARLEPWSVMKFSFLMSLVAWVVLFVAVAFLYFVLSSLGVFTSIQHTLTSVTSSSGSAGASLNHWFSASRVLGYTMLLGAVNIVLITALSTVGAMIYNLVTHLGGGIEVTLRETD